MKGLDGRRVIVRLHLEHHSQPVTDIHCTRVLLTWGQEDPRCGGREVLQKGARMLVGAVLAPQGTEHAQLNVGGLPAQAAHNQVVFRLLKGNLVQQLLVHQVGRISRRSLVLYELHV